MSKANEANELLQEIDDIDMAGTMPTEEPPPEETQDQVPEEVISDSEEQVAGEVFEETVAEAVPGQEDTQQVAPEEPPNEAEYEEFLSELTAAAARGYEGPPTEQPTPPPQLQPEMTPGRFNGPPEQVVQTPPTEPARIVSVEEMQEAFESPEKMVTLMHKVYHKGVETTMAMLPGMVGSLYAGEARRLEARQRFFTDNPELAKYPDFVTFIAKKVDAANPGMKIDEKFKLIASTAKKQLPMLLRATRDRARQQQTQPTFAAQKPGQRQRKAPKPTALEAELNEMPDRF